MLTRALQVNETQIVNLSKSSPLFHISMRVEKEDVALHLIPFNPEGREDFRPLMIDDRDTLIALKDVLNEAFKNK